MDSKKQGLIVVVLMVLSFAVGKYFNQPAEKIMTKEIVKEVKVKEDKNLSIETEEVIVKCDPNNNTQVIKKTKVVDLGKIQTNIKEQNKEQTIIKNKPKWLIGGGYGLDNKANTTYSGEINRRVLDLPAYVGLQVIGNKENQTGLIKVMVEF